MKIIEMTEKLHTNLRNSQKILSCVLKKVYIILYHAAPQPTPTVSANSSRSRSQQQPNMEPEPEPTSEPEPQPTSEPEPEEDTAFREYIQFGISAPGLRHLVTEVFQGINAETTTSDVCQLHVKPRTLPRGWNTIPELTDAKNRYYKHTYVPDPAVNSDEGAPQPTARPSRPPRLEPSPCVNS